MPRRPIVRLVDLCSEVGVEHLQVTEVLRRLHSSVLDGNDVIVQDFGTFYKRTSKPRVRVLNGESYDVPERIAVALKGPRFPGRELDCESLGGYRLEASGQRVGNILEGGGGFNNAGVLVDAIFNLTFVIGLGCRPDQEGTVIRQRVRISIGWSFPNSLALGATGTVSFGDEVGSTFTSTLGSDSRLGLVFAEFDLADIPDAIFTFSCNGRSRTIRLPVVIVRTSDNQIVEVDELLA